MDSIGVQYEGETPPTPDTQHMLAIEGFGMLANGMGAIDWAGLPIVAALLGIEDIEAFTRRLITIKHFRPDRPDRPEDDNDVTSHTLN